MPKDKTKKIIKKSKAVKTATLKPWYYETNPLTLPSPSGRGDGGEGNMSSTWKKILIAAIVFLVPFISWPWTFSPHELPKMLFLGLVIAASLGAVVFRGYFKNKGLYDIFPKHISVPLGLAAFVCIIISAIKAGVFKQGLLGPSGAETLSILGILLLMFVVLLSFHFGKRFARAMYLALILSGSALSLITIISLLGFNPYTYAQMQGWNPVGTTTTAAIIAAVAVLLTVGRIIEQDTTHKTKILLSAALIPPLVLIIGSAFRAPFIILAVGLAILTISRVSPLTRGGVRGGGSGKETIAYLTIACIFAILLAIFPTYLITTLITIVTYISESIQKPVLVGITDLLRTPLEVGPSHKETWSITRQALNDSPLFGSGPTTFSADYLSFRSLPILQTPFWNVSFDWGSSAALTLLATLGWIGSGFLFLAILSALISCLRKNEQTGLLAVAVSLVVAAFLAPLPIAALFIFSVILGLMLVQKKGAPTTSAGLITAFFRPLAGLFALVIIILSVAFGAADVLAFQGTRIAQTDLAKAEKKFILSSRLNPCNDNYLRLITETGRVLLRSKLNEPAPQPDQQTSALTEISNLADSALKSAKAATELAPQNAANWSGLGNIYLDIGSIASGAGQAAVEAFESALKLSPSDPVILVNLSLAKSISDQQPKEGEKTAADILLQAIELRPSMPAAHLELARLFAKQGQIEQATDSYNKAASLLPDDAALHYEIGVFLLQNKKYPEAQIELEQAVALASNFSNARWFLAQVYEEQKELQKAVAQIEKVIELNPDSQQAKDRFVELQKKMKK